MEAQAVIFDLDGVLVDSNALAEEHWKTWAAKHDVSLEHILAVHHGRPTVQTMREVAPHLDVEKEARLKEDAEADDTEGLQAIPGAGRLLKGLPEHRRAIVTSGTRRTATIRLNHCEFPHPRVFITSNDIQNGKPDPEPYQRAIELLGYSPADCVVIEDAPAGIASAKAAGARVIAVRTTNGPEALAKADVIVENPEAIEIEVTENGLAITANATA